MSNIIRFHQSDTAEKKIIQTKKIANKKFDGSEPPRDPVQEKEQLLKEVNALAAQYKELKQQISDEQANARDEIDKWWVKKQEEAKQEAEKLAEEATRQGYQAGFEQGVHQAEEEFVQGRKQMHDLIQTAYQEKRNIIQQSEPFLLSLSVNVAEKVIKQELQQHTDQLVDIVRHALKHIEESKDVVVQVSTEDYPVVLPFLEELRTYVDSEFKLVPVPDLAQGGCMIHTAGGSYDVTIDSQLQEIKKHLLAYCEEKTNDEPK